MADLMSIGLTGLRTSRNNLTVTGHNISNIDTPGFSRQRAVQVTNPAYGTGYGYVGQGARTQTIERIVDNYVVQQVRVDTSRLKDNQAFLKNISELDNLLSNENSALGGALNGFFDAVQSVGNDPLSSPARELLYSQADSVSQRFSSAQARLNDQSNNINTQLRTYASKVNELATGIAELNREIKVYQGTQNQPPNDLFDRREELLRELSEIVEVDVIEQDALDVHVFIGSGIPLIVGENVNKLEAVPGEYDKSRYDVYLTDASGAKMKVNASLTGGEMGGVLRYRTDTLDPALNEMGRIAMVFAGTFNNIHQQGVDRDGNQGGDFFTDINSRTFMQDRVPGLQRDTDIGVWIDPDQLDKLPAKEFVLKSVGGNLVLQDSVTGKNMTPAGGPFAADTAGLAALNDEMAAAYGFRITDAGTGTNPFDIDSASAEIQSILGRGLLISPTRVGASQLERSSNLSDTNKIALGGVAADENNAGTAKVNYADLSGQRLNAFGAPAVDLTGAELSYDAGTDEFTLTDKNGNTYGPMALDANNQLTFAVGGEDLVLSVQGDDLADGDVWVLEGSAGGANGQALALLQQLRIIGSAADGTGGFTLGETYAMLVEKVGIQTSESKTATDVSLAVLNQTSAMRESVSGVNLDEEAANLIRFQQAYQAATQIIAAAQKMFDTLLSSVGR